MVESGYFKALAAVATVMTVVFGVGTIVGFVNKHHFVAAVNSGAPVVGWYFLGTGALWTVSALKDLSEEPKNEAARSMFLGGLTSNAISVAVLLLFGIRTLGWVSIGYVGSTLLLFGVFLVATAGGSCAQCKRRTSRSADFCPRCGASLNAQTPDA